MVRIFGKWGVWVLGLGLGFWGRVRLLGFWVWIVRMVRLLKFCQDLG